MNLQREIFDNLYGNSDTCDLCGRRVLAFDLNYHEETGSALCDQCY